MQKSRPTIIVVTAILLLVGGGLGAIGGLCGLAFQGAGSNPFAGLGGPQAAQQAKQQQEVQQRHAIVHRDA